MKVIIYLIVFSLAFSSIFLSGCAEERETAKKSTLAEKASKSESMKAPVSNLTKAADFTLKDTKGKTVKLSDYSGKVVILDFWATWCPPCVKEIPHFVELEKEFGGKGLKVIGVSVDQGGLPAIEKFMKKTPINYPIVLGDQKVHQSYQSYLPVSERGGIPFTFIIDRQGNIRKHFVGYRPKGVFIKEIESYL